MKFKFPSKPIFIGLLICISHFTLLQLFSREGMIFCVGFNIGFMVMGVLYFYEYYKTNKEIDKVKKINKEMQKEIADVQEKNELLHASVQTCPSGVVEK